MSFLTNAERKEILRKKSEEFLKNAKKEFEQHEAERLRKYQEAQKLKSKRRRN